ncbi:MAG TPA: ABC transporter permease subunit [Aggregatilineales bacterium]|nr:ABC transporter permease subunit [Aggregatilineales bacterium]
MLSRENSEWWLRRRWLVRTILWIAIVNGIMAAVMWTPKSQTTPPSASQEGSQQTINMDDPSIAGSLMYILMGGLVTGIAVIIGMQGAVIDERKSGTAAWILSKPVARSAFILAKLVSNATASLLGMVIFQGAIAFILLTARTGSAPALLPFAAGVCLLGLHLLFYLTLTLMLGTLFEERGPVIGIPLASLIGAQLLLGISPFLGQIMPWLIVIPPGQGFSLAMLAILGQPLPTVTPIIATALWIVIFVGVAIWRFEREEF